MMNVLNWIKSYWYVPIALIGAVIMFVFFKRTGAIEKVLNLAKESYEREKKATEEINNDAESKKEEVEKKYKETVASIEKMYHNDTLKLSEENRKRVKELLEQYKDDEKGLAKKFSEEFGLNLEE